MGARREMDARSYMVATLRRDVAFGIIASEAHLRVERADAAQSHGRAPRQWALGGGDPDAGVVGVLADDFERGLEPRYGGHERR